MADITTINGTDLISTSRTTINTNFANLNQAIENELLGINPVTFSSAPTFDASLGGIQYLILTGNVSSSTVINLTAGQRLIFVINQDSVGSHSFVWPTNMYGTMTLTTGTNAINIQEFVSYDGINLYAFNKSGVSY